MEPPLVDANQQFCLRWHNYQTSLLSTLPQLLDGDDLTDVTLSAGGRHLKAHKVVLSACSHYFKQLFKEIGSLQHPVIVLPGVEFSDLCALVTFMYSGEVNIYQKQLASLLSMADTLHIRGLAEFTGDAQDYSTNKTSNNVNNNNISNTSNNNNKIKRQRLSSNTNNSNNNNNEINNNNRPIVFDKTSEHPINNIHWLLDTSNEVQDLSRKSNNTTSNNTMIATDEDTNKNNSNSNTSIGCLQQNVKAMEISPNNVSPGVSIENTIITTSTKSHNTKTTGQQGGPTTAAISKLFATCFICGKQLSNQYNLRVHMETHQNAFYACASCSHVSRSRDALRKHVSYRHPHATP